MKKPLRWVYPQSYQLLKAAAEKAGIHLYEFHALVDTEVPTPIVTVEREDTVWTETFPADDLIRATILVSEFFGTIMGEMATVTERAYQDFMHHREV